MDTEILAMLADSVQSAAQQRAVANAASAITITVAPDGAFQLRTPTMNRSMIVGVLTRATLLLAARMETDE